MTVGAFVFFNGPLNFGDWMISENKNHEAKVSDPTDLQSHLFDHKYLIVRARFVMP